jgi:NADPH-dependent 2,4-dienoyl-CoA reductase/sulfur reductase-like enzyme
MLAAKGGDIFYQLEVTVFAKTSTVLTRASSDVSENFHHEISAKPVTRLRNKAFQINAKRLIYFT